MRRILIVWELGGGYGHLDSFPDLALALRDQGHEVYFVLRDLYRAESILGKHGFHWLQAPLWTRQGASPIRSANYTEILTHFGYLDYPGLMGVVGGWRHIYDLLQPDLVIFNHAPTALLATAGTDIRCILYGTGFECPPLATPFPSILPKAKTPFERLEQNEKSVLRTINRILKELGAPPLDSVSDLFRKEKQFLCTFLELDPYYKHRDVAEYWGPRIYQYSGAPPKWPLLSRKKRIFAYLKPNYRLFQETLTALAGLQANVVVHTPGLKPDVAGQFSSEGLRFSTEPIEMAKALSSCDIAVCHAGHGTTSTMLLAGRPLLLLPMNAEQALTAQAVSRLGAGLYVDLEDKESNIKGLLETVLIDQAFTHGARAFAKRYPDYDQNQQTSSIAQRITHILSR